MRGRLLLFGTLLASLTQAQINTERVMMMGRNALYYEDYVLSIQRFNRVISAKPYLSEPYFFRGLAKFYLEDFTGAEQDCSEAIERNPYMANNYQLRALCRVNLKRYPEAATDYSKVIRIEPRNKAALHNLALCRLEMDDSHGADSCLDVLIKYWPYEAEARTLKAQAALNRADTTAALSELDKALEINAYEGPAWTMHSLISLRRGQYKQAEEELDKAITQQPRNSGLFINRALARYHQRNLRGALADYDTAIELEPNSYLGHFNRGLLRAQVGDDNRAIEDFDFVLRVEPDNMIALFNRALMLDNTGDFRGAIRDISAVIDENPNFWTGYQFRASIRRKIGDVYGAERDEFKVQKAIADYRYSGKRPTATQTRKRSEEDLENYDRLVVADTEETTHEYASDYRGRVQNRTAELSPEPLYVLTFYRNEDAVKRYIPFYGALDRLNKELGGVQSVLLSNHELTLDEARLNLHFASINVLTERLALSPDAPLILLARALDYYQVRDFESALTDLNRALELDPKSIWALMTRVQVRCRQAAALESANREAGPTASTHRMGYELALKDLETVNQLAPDLQYAHYNRGNIYVRLQDYTHAVEAYTRALDIDPQFPDAYYNRGVVHLLAGQLESGLADLSRAGELGLYSAYNLIKRYSKSLGK